ncbi:MAG: sodium:solute symporter family protein [Clostridia bacterium]|nr:sodium:solute symporter family protein [Clostridia bacterium]
MELTLSHLIGLLGTLCAITLLGLWSGRRVRSAEDFSTGGAKASPVMVTGSLMGTLVGGASTIGTAQLAFTYGFSALWFTLGAGLGCIALAFFVKPLRRSGCKTLQQLVAREYGATAGLLASLLGILGTLLSVVAQVLSGTALIGALLPLSTGVCAVLCVGMMMCYVLFGGMWGAGIVGTVKCVLLYAAALLGGALAWRLGGGAAAFEAVLPGGFGLFNRGLWVDAGAGLSLVLGVLSTQTYAQSVLSGRSDRAALQGVLASAVLIPPIGIGAALVGMAMRLTAPDMTAAQAFPRFVLLHMPGLLGGGVLATLLVTVLVAGAGLSLGIGTIAAQDIYRRFRPAADDAAALRATRLTIAGALLLSLVFTGERLSAAILSWSFMSMALRGAMIFLPLCGALFFPGRVSRRFAVAAIAVGPLTVLLVQLLWRPAFDPLFVGFAAALAVMLAGAAAGRGKEG